MAEIVKRRAAKSFDPGAYLKLPYSRVVVPEDDGTFRAEILEFPGCIATGDTEVDALAALKDVALSWLESVVAMGKAVPEPMETLQYSGKLVLRMPKTLHRKAACTAEREGVSLNQFIVSSVAEQIGMKSASNAQLHHFTDVVLLPYLVVSSGEFGSDPRAQPNAISTVASPWPIKDIKFPMEQLTGGN